MSYQVTYTKQALKQLKKLVNTANPRQHGKGLTANRSGEWRYRVGNYRILAHIKEDEIVIEVFAVGHRREIY